MRLPAAASPGSPEVGTIGTVGAMVPTHVGEAKRRGPRGRTWTIAYMSRATPENRRVVGRSKPLARRKASFALPPSPRDHGPDGPNGPGDSVRRAPWLRRPRKRVLRGDSALKAGTARPRRDHGGRWSRGWTSASRDCSRTLIRRLGKAS